MDELHEQTVNLLSFQQLPKAVFDSQVAFNLIDRYGDEVSAVPGIRREAASRAISRASSTTRLAVPSLMLLQAPIFHGHAFSLYIELEHTGQVEELTAALSGEHVDMRREAKTRPATSMPRDRSRFRCWCGRIRSATMASGSGPPPTTCGLLRWPPSSAPKS